jgi:hypothetical protein
MVIKAVETITTPDTITEEDINARLKRTGIRLQRRGDAYVLLYGGKLLLACNAEGQPLSLADTNRHTSRFR